MEMVSKPQGEELINKSQHLMTSCEAVQEISGLGAAPEGMQLVPAWA